MAADGARWIRPGRIGARLTTRRATIAGVAVWTAVVAALTTPSPIGGVGGWLDGSWQVGLLLSHRLGLPLGSRLVFPYGPYGYLDVTIPFFIPQWLEGVAVGLLVHVAFVALMGLLLCWRRAGPVTWVLVTLAVLIGLPALAAPDAEGQLVAAVLAYVAVSSESGTRAILAAALCGSALALVLLMKATAVPLAGGVLVVCTGGLVLRHRGRAAVALVAATTVVGAALWFAAGLGLGDLAHYLRAALELGSGYSAAMYFMGLTVPIVLGTGLLVVLLLLALGLFVRRRALDGLWILLVSISLFPLYKDSFVRDGPIRDDIFFGVAGLLAALSLAVVAPRFRGWSSRRQALPAAVLLACTAVGMGWRSTDLSPVSDAGARLAAYRTALDAVVNGTVRRSLEAAPLRSAHDYYQGIISALPAAARTSTIDAIPWDVGIFYVQGNLHWDPRPVLQSYTAYTPWLDQQDAAFLLGPSAPAFIIYSYLTIDDRYAAFDEPAAFRALLEGYRMVEQLGTSAVLLERVPAAPPLESVGRTTCAKLGTPVEIPQRAGVRTYARISVSRTLVGSALNLFSKSPGLGVSLSTGAGPVNRRLVPAVAADGLYVSDYLSASPDIGSAMAGTGGVPIRALTLSGNTRAWSSDYCVTLTTTPLSGQGP